MKEDEIDNACNTRGKINKRIENVSRKFTGIFYRNSVFEKDTETSVLLLYGMLCLHRCLLAFR
jgi:hypothetical protein